MIIGDIILNLCFLKLKIKLNDNNHLICTRCVYVRNCHQKYSNKKILHGKYSY